MSNLKRETVPTKALTFTDKGCFAKAKEGTEEGKRSFEMLAYSGGVVKNHWYWGDLIINLKGMSFPKRKYPILEQHDINKKIGFIKRPKEVGNELFFDDITYLDNEVAKSFISDSLQGFPFEASIAAKPTEVIRLENGAKAFVNGATRKGPLTIWQKSTFRESSVCVFGYDMNTSSKAFADEGTEFSIDVLEISGDNVQQKGENKVMELDEFKEQFPKLHKKIVDGAKDEAKTDFEAQDKDTKSTLSSILEALETLSTTVVDQGKKLLKFEKNEILRAEREIREGNASKADTIFQAQIDELHLPKKYHKKIKKMVNHKEFVKDDVLNEEAFSDAVKIELKDWVHLAEEFESDDIEGFSAISSKGKGKNSEEEDNKWVDDMLRLAQPEHSKFIN